MRINSTFHGEINYDLQLVVQVSRPAAFSSTPNAASDNTFIEGGSCGKMLIFRQ